MSFSQRGLRVVDSSGMWRRVTRTEPGISLLFRLPSAPAGFLHGLIFGYEDGTDILRNAGLLQKYVLRRLDPLLSGDSANSGRCM
jgi:hypothetical protein